MDKFYKYENQSYFLTEPCRKKKSNSTNRLNIKKNSNIFLSKEKNKMSLHHFFSKNRYSINHPTIKLYPTINTNRRNLNTLKNKKSGTFYTTETNGTIEKEKVINKIFSIEDDINIQNMELEEYKNYYNKFQSSNLTFKIIIEKILKNQNKINEENNSEKKNKKINQKTINILKSQIENYDKVIEVKEKILDKAKKKKRTNNFLNINKLLDEKNRELENLVTQSQQLQYSKYDINQIIELYFSSIKNYKDFNNRLQDKLKKNEKNLIKIKIDIGKGERELEEYKNKVYKLEDELDLMEDNKIDKEEQFHKIKEEYELQRSINEERNKVYKDLENINDKIGKIKKVIEKNKLKLNQINSYNDDLLDEISCIKFENKKLKEKIKQTQKIKQKHKNLEKNIETMKNNIVSNKIKYKEIRLKEQEDKEKFEKELEEFEKAKKSLINKINDLTQELKDKTKENTLKEEELTKVNDEYNNIINDKK